MKKRIRTIAKHVTRIMTMAAIFILCTMPVFAAEQGIGNNTGNSFSAINNILSFITIGATVIAVAGIAVYVIMSATMGKGKSNGGTGDVEDDDEEE